MIQKLCFIDCETTGLDAYKNGLIQLAGKIVIDGEERESFNHRIQPFSNDQIDQRALDTNGITREELKEYPSPVTIYTAFTALLGKYVDKFKSTDKFHFVAYNAPFDMEFVRAFFKKNNDEYFGSWFWFPPIDVMGIVAFQLQHKRASLSNFKLLSVAQHYGLPVKGKAHDAMFDIELTQRLYEKIAGTVHAGEQETLPL